MFELLNELRAESEALFNVLPGYSNQKDKIRDIIDSIEELTHKHAIYEEVQS